MEGYGKILIGLRGNKSREDYEVGVQQTGQRIDGKAEMPVFIFKRNKQHHICRKQRRQKYDGPQF